MDKFLSYDIKNGKKGTAQQEWAPHNPQGMKFFEWQYFTAPMKGDNGHTYFLLYCVFNFGGKIMRKAIEKGAGVNIAENQVPMITIAHICDYDDNVAWTTDGTNLVNRDELFDEKTGTLFVKGKPNEDFNAEFSYMGDDVRLVAKNDIYECDIKCTGGNRVMWMQDKLGIEGLIIEGAKHDRSFYYSLPQLPFEGVIKYKDNSGTLQTVHVTGEGWVDRQWGDFLTNAWEWTSFRFNDGDRVNTYNFPSGHQVCTYQKADGTTKSFDGFKVIQNGYLRTPKNEWVSWGWDYELPLKDGKYKLVPYGDQNIVFNQMLSFFEGLSDIRDTNGNSVGCAVTESMDVRKMHNGPYDKFNNFPEKSEKKWK